MPCALQPEHELANGNVLALGVLAIGDWPGATNDWRHRGMTRSVVSLAIVPLQRVLCQNVASSPTGPVFLTNRLPYYPGSNAR
eukprot:3316582-Lingulodinium_polyedra.AAC.1